MISDASVELKTIECRHCGREYEFLPSGGRERVYCSRSCKDMHYQQTENGKKARIIADRKWYYSLKGIDWRENYNTEVRRIQGNRLSRKRQSYDGNGLRRLELDNWACTICGFNQIEEAIQISHIVPRSRGGTNDIGNLRSLCANCHAFISSWQKIFLYRDTTFDWEVLYEEVLGELRARYASKK